MQDSYLVLNLSQTEIGSPDSLPVPTVHPCHLSAPCHPSDMPLPATHSHAPRNPGCPAAPLYDQCSMHTTSLTAAILTEHPVSTDPPLQPPFPNPCATPLHPSCPLIFTCAISLHIVSVCHMSFPVFSSVHAAPCLLHVHLLWPAPFLVHVLSLIHTASYPHAFMSSPLPVKKSSLVTSSFSPHLTLLFSHHCAVSWFFNMLVLKSQMDL